MAPLIENMSRQDAQWAKFKASYMWNDVYYRRRTKFALYQIASNTINACLGLGIAALRKYNETQQNSIPGFPNAHADASDLVGSLGFNVFSGVFLALFFGAALFFDLFWPERKEAPCIQWTWKLGASASSTFQLAACLAMTIIAATHSIQIHGASAEQKSEIISNWNGPSLAYQHDGRVLGAVVTGWVGWSFTFWSTIVMWQVYAHNNKYGPFADHVRKAPLNAESDPHSGTTLGYV